jgi:hypothetical protein
MNRHERQCYLDAPARLVLPYELDAVCARQRDVPTCDPSHAPSGTIRDARRNTEIAVLIHGATRSPNPNRPDNGIANATPTRVKC